MIRIQVSFIEDDEPSVKGFIRGALDLEYKDEVRIIKSLWELESYRIDKIAEIKQLINKCMVEGKKE